MASYHKYTEEEDELIRKMVCPDGITHEQMLSRRKRMGWTGKKCAFERDWTPAMDLAVIDLVTGGMPKGWRNNPIVGEVPTRSAQKRHAFLKKEYYDVGWGDLIGTQKITKCEEGEDWNV